MGEEEKKVTFTKEDFMKKSMDVILEDKVIGANGMFAMMGMSIVMTLAQAFFDEKGENA